LVRTAIIIPVKGSEPKRRLTGLLTAGQRRQLQVAMLEDTLQTLLRAGRIRDAFVVSPDPAILELAERFGARGILEAQEEGVNSAVRLGLQRTRRYASRMVVPADIPLLAEGDLRMAESLAEQGADVVISPSAAFDGTNLLLVKGDGLELHYDDDSFRRHVRGAVEAGLVPSVYYSEGVGLDIDTPGDVDRLLGLGARTSTSTFLARTLHRRGGIRPRMRRGRVSSSRS